MVTSLFAFIGVPGTMELLIMGITILLIVGIVYFVTCRSPRQNFTEFEDGTRNPEWRSPEDETTRRNR